MPPASAAMTEAGGGVFRPFSPPPAGEWLSVEDEEPPLAGSVASVELGVGPRRTIVSAPSETASAMSTRRAAETEWGCCMQVEANTSTAMAT